MRRPGGEARQPRGVWELGQLGRPDGAGDRGRSRTGGVVRKLVRPQHRLPVRPAVPPGIAPCRGGPPPAPVPDAVQPGGAAVQPGQPCVSAHRHDRRRPGRTDGGRAGANAACPPGGGRHRFGWPGRGDTGRADPGPGGRVGRRPEPVLDSGGFRPGSTRCGRPPRRTGLRTAPSGSGGPSPANRARSATTCWPTPPRRSGWSIGARSARPWRGPPRRSKRARRSGSCSDGRRRPARRLGLPTGQRRSEAGPARAGSKNRRRDGDDHPASVFSLVECGFLEPDDPGRRRREGDFRGRCPRSRNRRARSGIIWEFNEQDLGVRRRPPNPFEREQRRRGRPSSG